MRGLLTRRLQYPARPPLLNQSHPAVTGQKGRVAAVARMDNTMVDLLSGYVSKWQYSGVRLDSIGPAVFPNTFNSGGFPFPAPYGQETFTQGTTLAAIWSNKLTSKGQGIVNTSQDITQGTSVKLGESGGALAYGFGGNQLAIGPGASIISGRDYFSVVSIHPTTATTPRVIAGVVDLTTGQKWINTFTTGTTLTVCGTNMSLVTYIGGVPDQNHVAAGSISARAITMGEMVAWLDDPWSLWYDPGPLSIVQDTVRRNPHSVGSPTHLTYTGNGASIAISAGIGVLTKTSAGTQVANTLTGNAGSLTDTPGAATLTHTVGTNSGGGGTGTTTPPPVTVPITTTPFGHLTQPPGTSIVPTTLLEAINEMLAAVGRGPVSSVIDPTNIGGEEQKALAILNDMSVEVQTKGWWFNSEYEYILTPNPLDGTIPLPINCLTVRRTTKHFSKQTRPQYDRHRIFTMRGVDGKMYLYDIANHTFSWIANSAALPVDQPLQTGALAVDMVLAYPWEDIPQPIRWFILCKAARTFAVGRVPDMQTFRFGDATLTDAEAEAYSFDREQRPQEPEVNPHFARMRQR